MTSPNLDQERVERAAETPARVWLRVAGGGVSMPSGRAYTTMVGDDREQPRHVEYVRADAVNDLVEALEFIREGYANQDVNHVDFRVKVYEVALDALNRAATPTANGKGE